jgi:hypothetical protein
MPTGSIEDVVSSTPGSVYDFEITNMSTDELAPPAQEEQAEQPAKEQTQNNKQPALPKLNFGRNNPPQPLPEE